MTEKRYGFEMDKNCYKCIVDVIDKKLYTDKKQVVDLLNSLSEENEQLKTQLQNISDQRDEFYRGARENANRVGKLEKENKQLKQTNERICDDIDLALGFIRHKGYSLQDIKDYEDAKKEYEEDLKAYRKGDVDD